MFFGPRRSEKRRGPPAFHISERNLIHAMSVSRQR